jgi:limonene-1,2-epoxide hydrolase
MSLRRDDATRRRFLASGAGGVFGALAGALLPRSADAQSMGELERTNIGVVTAMCQSWKTGRAETIAGFVTEDFRFRGSAERMEVPPTQNRQAFIDSISRFLTTATVEMVVHDTFARGSIVVNIHQQLFNVKDQGLREDWYIGMFHLVDGKVREWNDYAIVPFSSPRQGRAKGFGRFVRTSIP